MKSLNVNIRNGVGFPHNCDIQKCKLAVKILTNIDNEEWREENFEQSNYSPTNHLAIELQHISKKYQILSVFYGYQKRFKYHILAHIQDKYLLKNDNTNFRVCTIY
jgi:hypothetical protein